MKITYNGRIDEDGRLKIWKRGELVKELSGLRNMDVTLTIEEYKKPRSSKQNRYYHGVVLPMVKLGLMDRTGEIVSLEEVKTFLSYKFITREVADPDSGEVYKIARGTSDLSTKEFNKFTEDIQHWASYYLGIEIPDPGEQLTLEV